MSLQDRLLKKAQSHGFRCYKGIGDSIVVYVGWIDSDSKKCGIDSFTVDSMPELLEILGY